MHTLPTLATRRGPRRLPLVESTAERLSLALLADEPRRREHFAAALADDPVLAVWTLARAHQADQDKLDTLADLSAWISTQPDDLFFPGDAPEPAPAEHDASDPRTLAGRALAAAEAAAHSARKRSADVERAQLLGLVHQAPAWLNDTGESSAPSILPAWLDRALNELDRPVAEQSPEVACLAEALAAVESQGDEGWQARGNAWAREGPWCEHFAALVVRVAALAQLQEDFDRALESAKLEALKELAYGAGHEINNPLANISARAQTLLADETDPERRRMLAAMNAQAFRAHEMIADMMLFARPPVPEKAPTDLVELVAKLGEELSPRAQEQGTELRLRLPERPLEAHVDATQIAVAVRSLCVNALEALVTGGRIEIELSLADAQTDLGDAAQIVVRDDGPGIADSVRPHIFDPYYSGREAGRGLGLGLSKCWRIVTGHGGRVDVEGCPERGAAFTITLPQGNAG